VTGYRDERPIQPVGHVPDEPRLAASGRSLEHDGHAALGGRQKQLNLAADVRVVGFLGNAIAPDVDFMRRFSHVLSHGFTDGHDKRNRV